MDRIDSFVISATHKSIYGLEFKFVLHEADMKNKETKSFIDEIIYIVNKLCITFPQFTFTWASAHKITQEKIYEEILHQVLVQR